MDEMFEIIDKESLVIMEKDKLQFEVFSVSSRAKVMYLAPHPSPPKHTHKEVIKSLSFNSFQGKVSFSFQRNKTKGNCNIGGMELKDSENLGRQYAFRGLNFTDLSITNFLYRKSVKVYG